MLIQGLIMVAVSTASSNTVYEIEARCYSILDDPNLETLWMLEVLATNRKIFQLQ
jgi:hypothetical protein